jgi:ABC-type molybdate transport system permease subunit
MGILMWLFLFMCWIIFSFVVASVANSKGRSYGFFLVLSLLISPVITGLILILLGFKHR